MFIFASDPHGTGQPWINLVESARNKYPTAQVVFGGDYIDGRPFAQETLEYIFSIPNAIILRGNHEDMFIKGILNNDELNYENWLFNGGKTTIKSFLNRRYPWHGKEVKRLLLPYAEKMLSMKLFYNTDHIIFVHAGIRLDGNKTDDKFALWARQNYWYINQTNHNFEFAHNNTGKTIITGHTPTCFIEGVYEKGFEIADHIDRKLTKGEFNHCPVKIIQYKGEPARIFTDGGCNPEVPSNNGNIVILSNKGEIVETIS